MRLHNLPSESLTICDEHKRPVFDKGKVSYTCTEDYYFDHNGNRAVVHFRYYTSETYRISTKRSAYIEISRLTDYDTKRNCYKTSLGTEYITIENHKELSSLLKEYRQLREMYLEPSDRYNGAYYRKAA